jgi:hypothetical protein
VTEIFPRLFSPMKLAGYTLGNRIAIAPLTRQMAEPDGTPTDEMVAYYAHRARGGCGLIITEGTYEEDRLSCRAYLSQPGIANVKHVAAWRKVTDAVHKHGTRSSFSSCRLPDDDSSRHFRTSARAHDARAIVPSHGCAAGREVCDHGRNGRRLRQAVPAKEDMSLGLSNSNSGVDGRPTGRDRSVGMATPLSTPTANRFLINARRAGGNDE